MKTEKEKLIFLLDLANEMRVKNNDSQLDDLPMSIPGSIGKCIVANAFNYGCEVYPSKTHNNIDGTKGHILFKNEKDCLAYIKIIGNALKDNVFPLKYGGFYKAPLSKELNQIALAFDEGRVFTEYVNPTWISAGGTEEAGFVDIAFQTWHYGYSNKLNEHR